MVIYALQVTVDMPIQLQVFAKLANFKIDETNESSACGSRSEWSIFVVPYEFIQSNFVGEEIPNEPNLYSAVELLWSPNLERRVWLPSDDGLFDETLVHEVSFVAVKPGVHSLYIGALRHSTGDVVWHHECIKLIALHRLDTP